MDHQVERCLSCGQELGVGRYCASCGRAKAEAPPRRAPVSPPPVYEAPPPARYPLFADEAGAGATPAPAAPVTPAQSPAQPPPPGLAETTVTPAVPSAPPARTHGRRTDGRRRKGGPRWIVAAVAAVLLLGAGGLAVLGGSDPDPEPGLRADPGSVSGSADPTTGPDGSASADPGGALDLVRVASASPPGTAAPSRDVRGNAVQYEAANMLDGRPDTAWRVAGDASGKEVLFELDAPTRITEVGLINGYAKVEPGYDGYAANRRIASVEWVFADGTVVPQSLAEELGMQSIPVPDVVSDSVTLRILTVSEPASGTAGRDYTAISDVNLVGPPA